MEKNTGILLIDKPTAISSHGVVNRIRRLTGVKRVGHAGTLDPLATGLLILLVGRDFTKQQSPFLKQDKTYLCTARLGVETDTYDIDGQVVNQAPWAQVTAVTKSQLAEVINSFKGASLQTVPAFSAVKVKGKKLYQKARQGQIQKQDLPARTIMINQLKLLDFSRDESVPSLDFRLEVDCGSGTYIRSLIHDIGQQLGVGATVTSLRRIRIGSLSLNQAFTLEELEELARQGSSLPFLIEIPDLKAV